MSKHQTIYQEMLTNNPELFSSFKVVHEQFASDKNTYRKKFNEIGEQVVDTIRKYEKMLCSKTDSGGYGKYSSGLSDRFWENVRRDFPLIDFVGVE